MGCIRPCESLPTGRRMEQLRHHFREPRFDGETVVKRACVTLIFNGVLVHHRVELLGSTAVEPIARYQPHAPEEPFSLQAHAGPVRYRNIWVRRLLGYDV